MKLDSDKLRDWERRIEEIARFYPAPVIWSPKARAEIRKLADEIHRVYLDAVRKGE